MYINLLLCIVIFFKMNAVDEFGQSPLHYACMTPSETVHYRFLTDAILYEEIDLNLIDQISAKIAAALICVGCQVTIKNRQGKSPLDYATQNKEKLPKTYQVLIAGYIKDEFAKKALRHIQVYPNEMLALQNALGVLDHYRK